MDQSRDGVKTRELVLGVEVDMLNRREAVGVISEWVEIKSQKSKVKSQNYGASGGLIEESFRMKVVVTAYSEFFVRAEEDKEFRKVLEQADLVLPDGVSVLAAVRYRELNFKFQARLAARQVSSFKFKGWRQWYTETMRLMVGLWVGVKVITGNVGEPVTGVWLVEELLRLANEKKWRVFLLGGYGDTAEKLRSKIKSQKSKVQVKSNQVLSTVSDQLSDVIVEADAGSQQVENASEEENQRVIKKINEFVPDLLLVAYGPGKQEKWLNRHKSELYASVGIGVGGTFDELSGKIGRAPVVMEKMGLKWLWRLAMEPKRWKRMWRAVGVFPYEVWREELKQDK